MELKNPFKADSDVQIIPEREKIEAFVIGYKKDNQHFLKEKGKVDFRDFTFSTDIAGIKDRELAKKIQPLTDNYDLYLECYRQIPKVFRAFNTRANFAIQSGFKLLGDKSDVEKIEKWMRKVHFDNYLIQIVKEMLIYGNVYISPFGHGDKLELKFLPVTTMRVVREPSGEHTGFVQIYDRKLIDQWKYDELIHYKWNPIGTYAYGVSELRPLKSILEKKLDNEEMIASILKSQYIPKVIFKCGQPEKPFSTTQIGTFKSTLENKDAGSDVLVPGDVDPKIIQHSRGSGESIIALINHIEEQVDTGLNFPEILIAGRADAQGSIIQMDSLERDVKTIQDVLGMGIENGIFKRVLDKEDVPKIVWNAMNIETELRASRTLRQLVGDSKADPIITIDEARDRIGFQEMTEEQKKAIKDMKEVGMNNGLDKPFGQSGDNPSGGAKAPMPKVQKVDKSKPSA